MMSAADIARKLPKARREGSGWQACCPAHDDGDPSLSITEKNGKVLLKCRAGCDQAAVIAALRDLGLWPARSNGHDPDPPGKRKGKMPRGTPIAATYSYTDENGTELFQVLRKEWLDELGQKQKNFPQRHADGKGGWIWSTEGVRRVPYRLPELIEAAGDRVYILEGEKDVERARTWGLFATCNPEGAGHWRPEFARYFDGADVVVIPDNDNTGRAHAHTVAGSVAAVAAQVRILELPGLSEKGDFSDWVAAGGTPEKLDELVEDAPIFQREDPGPRTIRVVAGERHKAADDGLAAMQAAVIPFYVRDRKIVQVCHTKAKSSDGKIVDVPAIIPVELPILSRALGQSARWERLNTKGNPIRIDPPKEVVEQIAGMIEEWPFPPLAGVIGTPSLRSDGSLLATEGYDPQTGFVLLSPPVMPPIPECPSRDDAEAAMALLAGLLTEFPFVNDASRSVAMSMLITPVVRAALPPAVPLHVVTAPESGTGKSYLLDIASVIATGDRCAVMAMSKPEETEKRLIGAALAGHPIIALDNCSTLLLGDFLCQVTERPLMRLRPLGTSKDARVANSFTVFADGNNLTVGADVVRRTLQCALDADMEEPSDREFLNNPVEMVLARRGDYIAACLTIVRAYIAAGLPGRLPPVPSFEKWSDLVRSSLVWLGYPDPVATTKTVRNEDPVRQTRGAFFSAWATELGCSQGYRTADLIDLAETRPDWQQALLAIARPPAGPPRIDLGKLGYWLRGNANTIAAGLKLIVDRNDKKRPKWQIQFIERKGKLQ